MEEVFLSDENYISIFNHEEDVDALLIGGYAKIIHLLAENLDIRLSTPVSKVDYTTNQIQVHTENQVLKCDKVICTVPLGVLKSNQIQFLPALSAQKQQAIQSLGYGNLEKVSLTFDKVFWGDHHFTIYAGMNENGIEFPSISDFTPFTNVPTLGIYYANTFGERMMKETDEAILKRVLTLLEKIFKVENLQPTAYHISRWLTDPYFQGSYSYASSNEAEQHIQTLGAPIDNSIFFAGEATSHVGQACVHGALLSGVREARRLGATLKGIKGLEEFFENFKENYY